MTGINWGDFPTYLAVAVAAVGGTAALYQLHQQGEVLKGEVERNKRRDELLDRQLNESWDRERRQKRKQAELIDVTWADQAEEPGTSLVVVINGSRRPVTKVKCAVFPDDEGAAPVAPLWCAEMLSIDFPVKGWMMPDQAAGAVTSLRVLRPGARAGFQFGVRKADCPLGEADVGFTDDIGLSWSLASDLALSEA